MKPWRKLIGMSEEVAKSIIKRARLTNRAFQEGLIAEASLLGEFMEKGAAAAFPIEKIAFLDMDGTLIKKRFIFEFSKSMGFFNRLEKITSSPIENYAKTKAIASLMRGFSKSQIIEFAKKLDLSVGALDLVKRLKKSGFFTVLMTDSYESVALTVANKLGVDLVIANRLSHENGICTGDVVVNPLFFPNGPSCANHASCKLTAAMRFCSAHEIQHEKTLAVGDGENDLCLLRFANQSFAYLPVSPSVANASKMVVENLNKISF
jgi:HAD superfamily phosphoserine phosphatase-like hydrolase